ncbi:16S rRNA (guanine(527)-N(7))-methyltransferase RsmG [Sphingobium phenoxybenzoativorans]|uniref:Ribosomal RNA small subunit methyltransferase G n=1 Tax=Sphingobium phenoxybenzoativorans TaxID=1592790 RepID=A0A975K7A9_9SPHN|nr:16S rRNA (guanine(527)-N(7))-methyltransferase RsmG [Sphingobium phenoxybenzoativorans]QUT06121.1 16S rRNA (guanine(527)-N(7))-methyltransferase RsmG [Sphingobium phenoxybenzoativorans]
MTEDEARAWIAAQFDVSRETWAALEKYIALLFDEMTRQNLIAESTRDHVWSRHIVDSAQLLVHAGEASGKGDWIDLGSGAGLPGVVVAILSGWRVVMVESRRKRIDFLNHVIDALDLHASVFGGRVEMLRDIAPGAVISARAFAPLPRLFSTSAHLSTGETLWLLPKGKNWQNELETAQQTWQGAFHVERSITDPDSAIIVARSVKKRGRS